MPPKTRTPVKNTQEPEEPKVPEWFWFKDSPVFLKREVESALVEYAVDNNIQFGSCEFKEVSLKELTPILRRKYARWAKVKSKMMNTYKYPCIYSLNNCLRACKNSVKTFPQLMEDYVQSKKIEAMSESETLSDASSQGQEEESGEDEIEEINEVDALLKRAVSVIEERTQSQKCEEESTHQNAIKSQETLPLQNNPSFIDETPQSKTNEKEVKPLVSEQVSILTPRCEPEMLTEEESNRWHQIGLACKRMTYHQEQANLWNSTLGKLVQGTPFKQMLESEAPTDSVNEESSENENGEASKTNEQKN